MIVYDSQGRKVQLGGSAGHGGEATVYRVQNAENLLAKVYNPRPRPNYGLKLAWMVNHPPENPTRSLEHPSLAWPSALLYDSKGNLLGYQMPHIQHAVPLLDVFNPRRRAEVLPEFDRRYLHRTARNLAAAYSALHSSGYVAGDVNESNVLVTPTALVTLIDTDSFQVREQRDGTEIIYPCPVGKPEYTPPELQGKALVEVTRHPDHDSFGLAVLIFQLLMEGSHPFRAQWLGQGDPPPIEARIAQGAFPYVENPSQPVAPPRHGPGLDTLHPWLAELFRRCFVDGFRAPRWRPGPELWARAIGEAEQALVCCAEGHFYSSHLYECPYCALAQKKAVSMPKPQKNWAARSAASPFYRPRPARQPVPGTAGQAQATPPAMGKTPAQPASAGRTGPGQSASSFFNPLGGWPGAVATAGAPGRVGGMPGFRGAGVLRSYSFFRGRSVRTWLRQKTIKSFIFGGAYGALAGAVPGGMLAVINWSAGMPLNWSLLLALSGATGGLLRGWLPGYRLADLVNRYIGWKPFWEFVGLATGAVTGGLMGMVFGWAVIPVILGLVLGARSGLYVGNKFWQFGDLFGWERIWGTLTAFGAAGLGWLFARAVGSLGVNYLGAELVAKLIELTLDGSPLTVLPWLLAGSLSGAFFGALSGVAADLFGRLSGLVD